MPFPSPRRLLAASVLGLFGFIPPQAAVAAEPKVLEASDIEPVWSGHSVGFDLLTTADRQFAAYYDAERRMTVAGRRIGDKAWTIQKLDSVLGWDSHNYVTLALDRAGHLHVCGNMHVVPLVYFRSEKPFDVSTLKRVPQMVGQGEKRTTYPLFYHLADGTLLFLYRDGMSGDGISLINRYDEKTQAWTRHMETPLFDGKAQSMSAYPDEIRQGPDGWFHLVWMWRDTPDCSSNHTLSHARSHDFKNWETMGGKPLALPLTPDNPDVVVDPVGPRLGLINVGFSVGFDAEKRPVINYHKHDAAGNSQIYLARFEDKAWKSRPVSNWNYRWAPEGGGTIVTEIRSQPVRLQADGRLTQSWSHLKEGGGTWLLDPATLAVKEKISLPREIPSGLGKPTHEFPDMAVRWKRDDEPGPSDKSWALRWESRGAYRDRQPEGPIPGPTMLTLYRFSR